MFGSRNVGEKSSPAVKDPGAAPATAAVEEGSAKLMGGYRLLPKILKKNRKRLMKSRYSLRAPRMDNRM
jgi:hypothetical protein